MAPGSPGAMCYRTLVLVVVIAMRSVAVPVMDVIHVILVSNCLVTAVGAVNMIGVAVGFVFGAGHVRNAIAHMRI